MTKNIVVDVLDKSYEDSDEEVEEEARAEFDDEFLICKICKLEIKSNDKMIQCKKC